MCGVAGAERESHYKRKQVLRMSRDRVVQVLIRPKFGSIYFGSWMIMSKL